MSTTSTHIDRKALKQQDEFYKSTKSFFDLMAENSKAVAVIAGILVLLAAAWAAYSSVRAGKEDEARSALFKARQTLEKELLVIAEKEPKAAVDAKADKKAADQKSKDAPAAKATAEDVAYKKLDVDQALPEGKKALLAVAEKHSGTRSAFEARLALGDLYYDHGQSALAIPHYEAASQAAPRGFEKAMAFYSLGYANENAGKFGDAAMAFDRALSLGEASLRAELLLALGRVHGLNKNAAEAKKALDKVTSEFPTSDQAKVAELLKSRVESTK